MSRHRATQATKEAASRAASHGLKLEVLMQDDGVSPEAFVLLDQTETVVWGGANLPSIKQIDTAAKA